MKSGEFLIKQWHFPGRCQQTLNNYLRVTKEAQGIFWGRVATGLPLHQTPSALHLFCLPETLSEQDLGLRPYSLIRNPSYWNSESLYKPYSLIFWTKLTLLTMRRPNGSSRGNCTDHLVPSPRAVTTMNKYFDPIWPAMAAFTK